MTDVERYVNKQGNSVEVRRDGSGRITSIEVSGTGSNRAFQAQLRAARKLAESSSV